MNFYRPQIVLAATKHNLDPDLVQALVEQESDYNPFAWNPEPRYHYFWNVTTRKPFRAVTPEETALKFPPHDFPTLAGDSDQEWWAQQASWGLTQILGAVAREHGCSVSYLTQLSDSMLNLNLGCQHLDELMRWARSLYVGMASLAERETRRSALAAYNGGRGGNRPSGVLRNGDYADRVLKRYDRIKKASI